MKSIENEENEIPPMPQNPNSEPEPTTTQIPIDVE